MVRTDLLKGRGLGLALLDGERAPRVEAATRRRVGQVRRAAAEGRLAAGVPDAGQARHPGARCRGYLGLVNSSRVGPSSTMRPAHMMPIRSAMLAWTLMSWVANTTDDPSDRRMSSSIARTFCCTTTSSAVVGSSALMMSGRQTVASAIHARCRMPPESS